MLDNMVGAIFESGSVAVAGSIPTVAPSLSSLMLHFMANCTLGLPEGEPQARRFEMNCPNRPVTLPEAAKLAGFHFSPGARWISGEITNVCRGHLTRARGPFRRHAPEAPDILTYPYYMGASL